LYIIGTVPLFAASAFRRQGLGVWLGPRRKRPDKTIWGIFVVASGHKASRISGWVSPSYPWRAVCRLRALTLLSAGAVCTHPLILTSAMLHVAWFDDLLAANRREQAISGANG